MWPSSGGPRTSAAASGVPRKGEHPGDGRVGGEGVTEAHEQRGDAAVVAGPRPGERTVEVGMEEQLGDREAAPVRRCRGHGGQAEVDSSQAGYSSQGIIGPGEGPYEVGRGGVAGAVAERSHRGEPHLRILGEVGGTVAHRPGCHTAGHEAERLDEASPRGRVVVRSECPLQGESYVVGGCTGPAFEGPLSDHARKAPGGHDGDETTHSVESGQAGAQAPRGVFAEERVLVGQQLGQQAVGAVVEHTPERMDSRDRCELVARIARREGERRDGLRSAIGGCSLRQRIGCSQRVDHERAVTHPGESIRHRHQTVFSAKLSQFQRHAVGVQWISRRGRPFGGR